MSKNSLGKRALAVVLTLVLLLSSMAVIGVSAATGTEYHYTFDASDGYNAYETYYSTSGNNVKYRPADGIEVQLVSGGKDGASHAMKMAYTKNAPNTTHVAAFSVPNNKSSNVNGRKPGQTVYLEAGATFRITVTYKVTAYSSPMELYFGLGLGALAIDNYAKWGDIKKFKIGDITAANSTWATMSTLVTPTDNTGAYFVLKAGEETTRMGTEVIIGAIDIVPVAVTTITFNSNGGSDVAAVYGMAGDPITYPEAPTKKGCEFLGWFDTVGNPAPTTFPASDTELVAQWRDSASWGFETEAVGTELSINNNANYIAKVTDEVSFSGDHALHVQSTSQAAVTRPQVLVMDGAGNRVAVKKGKSYDISFWALRPAGSQYTTINMWLTATGNDDVYTSGSQKDVEKIFEMTDRAFAQQGVWEQFTATVDECPYSGNVRLGITTNQGAGRIIYIDDLTIKESPYVAPEEDAWSFETEEIDAKLDMNSTSTETITVQNQVFHTGKKAVRVNCANSGGNERPQMLIKDADGNVINTEVGKNYLISFWVLTPAGGHNFPYSYYFTAANTTTMHHSSSYNKNDYIIGTEQVVNQTPVQGTWQRMTYYVENCDKVGALRLGITGHGANRNAIVFYVDDIKVQEVEGGGNIPQDFEGYAKDTILSLNTNSQTSITVTDAIAANGNQSAVVNSNTSKGNTRPQMMVKDGLERQVSVYKGRNYTVTFSVYIPESEQNYAVNYWLTATDDETCFADNGPKKDDYVIAEKSGTDQLTKGVWNDVTIEIVDCARSGKLRLGITGNHVTPHKFYIDDLNVVETPGDADRYTESYEPYELDTKLSLNADASAITVTDEERHDGYQALRFDTLNNNLDAAPQLVITDYRMRPISVEAGKRYRLSFWVVVPASEPDYDLKFWVAAHENDDAFTAANPRENMVLDNQTVEIIERGAWQQVMITINDCAASGNLRLGMTGSTAAAHTFYFDDLKLEERESAAIVDEAMHFENYAVGEKLSVNTNACTAIVTDVDAHSGNKAIHVYSDNNTGDNRPQFNVVDGNGEYVRVEKGQDYFLNFYVMVPTTESYFTFSYWAAAVPEDKLDTPFVRNSEFLKNDYVIGEVSGIDQPIAGEWHLIKLAITDCKHDGYLRVGFTHHNAAPFTSNFYIDDIQLKLPDYVTVKFETNGADNPEDYPPVTIMSETVVPTQEYVDPYRYGYEFMGWFTDKNFSHDSYVDIFTDKMIGENGTVITLYALWEEWTETKAEGPAEKEEDLFDTVYYTEKVWVGDQNVADPFTSGDVPTVNDAAPIVNAPKDDVQTDDGGMPPWLIVVIIVGAVVVVGGGAAIAAVLLKKNKKA